MSERPTKINAAVCPVCGKPVVEQMRPFCSKHCADVDLSRWLKGGYAIPAVEAPDAFPDETRNEPDDGESVH